VGWAENSPLLSGEGLGGGVDNSILADILTDGLTIGVVIIDAECRIMRWNRWMEKHSGLWEPDMIGKNLLECYPDIQNRKKAGYIRECIGKQQPFLLSPLIHHYFIPLDIIKEEETIRMFQHVRLYPFSENGGSCGAVIIINDLTEQILHEKEIFRLNRILGGLRNINKLIVKAISEEELMTGTCKILTQDVGYDCVSYDLIRPLPRTLSETERGDLSPESSPERRREFSPFTCREGGRGVRSESYLMQLITDGTVIGAIHIRSSEQNVFKGEEAELLKEVASDLSFALKTLKDRKKQQQTEENEKRLKEQLRQAQKMEAIGTLAGGIAHDFNNILFPILGYAEMTKLDMSDADEVRMSMSEIIQSVNRAKDLVNQILTFSRQTDKQILSPIRLQPIIKEGLRFLRASLPSTIEIRRNIDEHAGPVTADPTQIYQILINLCTNAYHAMRETGGILTIELKQLSNPPAPVPESEWGELPSPFRGGAGVKLSVSDTGCGIPPQIRDRIFDPYFTTKAQGEGTGMGLAIAHGIVRSCNGHIRVISDIGKGSVFEIFLPMAEEEADENVTGQGCDIPVPTGTGHILFIDDEEQNAAMVKRMLEGLGYMVTTLTDSRQALETFSDFPASFDLVLTDYTMPHLTGIRLAEEMIRIRPDIPVILFSGYSNVATSEQIKAAGIREYVRKPFRRRELAMLIKKITEPENPVQSP